MKKIREFLHKYRHAWLLSYAFIYLPWFMYLERTVTRDYHIMHASLDDLIPFNEYFIHTVPFVVPLRSRNIGFLPVPQQRRLLQNVYIPVFRHDPEPDHLYLLPQRYRLPPGHRPEQEHFQRSRSCPLQNRHLHQCLPKHPRLQCRRSPHCHQQKPDLSKISLPAVRITASHHFHLSGNHVFKTTLHHRCMRCLPDGLCHPLLSIRIRNRHRRQEDNRKSAWLKHQAPFYFIFLR